jgi:4-hydroxy-3-methylbut-2-enyl diphosphate reductase
LLLLRLHSNHTLLISSPDNIQPEWLIHAKAVEICGATSTPKWLMEEVAHMVQSIEQVEY